MKSLEVKRKMSYNYENLIVGCGNILFKDDGFGPAVIEYMKKNEITLPGSTCLIDGATSAPHYIFTLPEDKWKNIIIVDIAELGLKPGEIRILELSDVKEQDRYMDVHGITATYPLHKLDDEINIKLVVCQPEEVSEEMQLGLTKTLEYKIPETTDKILEVLQSML